MRYWRLDPLIDRAALGVTELLTNVHRHAQPDKNCTVEIELQLDRLTVSVRDHDPRLPVVGDGTDTTPMATCGRGLAMVAAVSESWGVRPHDDGKVVWFTLPASTATPQATRPPRRATEPVPRRIVEAEPATAGMPAPAHALAGSPAVAHATTGYSPAHAAAASPATAHASATPVPAHASAGPSATTHPVAGPPATAHAAAGSPAATHTTTGVSAAAHAPARPAVVS